MTKRRTSPRVNYEKIVDELIGRGTRHRWYEAARELVANAQDALVKKFGNRTDGNIRIEIVKKEGVVRFLDNGCGIEDPNSFYNLFTSDKEGDPRFIGQHGSGRIFALRHGSRIIAYSVTQANPYCLRMTLDRKMLIQIIRDPENPPEYEECPLPSWWHLRKGETGCAVEVVDVDWSKIPSIKDIIEQLASHLSPTIWRKTTVDGKGLKPLKVFDDQILHRTFHVENLGEVEVELYVPVKYERWHAVRLGAHNPVCDLREFANGLDSKLATLIPDLLFDSVAGDIFVPSLNPHVAPDRKSFKDSLYTGPHKAIVAFISDELEPILTEAYARKERSERRRRDAQMSRLVCSAINEAFDFDPKDLKKIEEEDGEDLPEGTKKPTEGLTEPPVPIVAKRRLEIMVADHEMIRVPIMEGVRETDIGWDAAHSGGFLNISEGPEVIYTAGEIPGKGFLLLAKDKASNRTIMETTITIVVSREFLITPSKKDFAQGSSPILRVRNYDRTSGKIGWKMQRQRGVRLLEREGLQTELVIADDAPLVTFHVTAYDMDNPAMEATGKYEIVVGDKGNYLKLRDCTGKDCHFEFKRATMHQSEMTLLRMDSRLAVAPTPDRRKTVGRVIANFEHPDFQHLQEVDANATEGKEAWLQLLTPSILLSFLDEQVRLGILDAADYSNEFHKLRHEVMKARARSRKK